MDIERNFTYHQPKNSQLVKYDAIRKTGGHFGKLIEQLCPDSRERSLALTKLEEAVMWANAAIARNE